MAFQTEPLRAQRPLEASVLETLQNAIGPQKYNAWFKNGTQISLENGHVKVLVPNTFVANWVETHFRQQIAEVIQAASGEAREVVVMVDPALSGRLRKGQLDMQARIVSRAASGQSRSTRSDSAAPLRHRLEDFVVGPSNKLAYSAARAVCTSQADAFNPLFVYGTCGVGKTHLLQGICQAAAEQPAGRAISWRYVTAEQFTNEYIAAVRKRTYAEFRNGYRKLDLLVIDDVHFFAAKKATQEEFLHTFNAIHSGGHQIVMASDAHPQLLGDLIEQLSSRFVAGMVVKIDPPDMKTRLQILRRRAKKMGVRAETPALEYIAEHMRSSVRELEGTLIRLAAEAKLDGQAITLALAREALSETLARTGSALTVGDIESAAGAYFGVTPADLHSSRRTRTVSVARMVAMFLARRHTSMSFPEIGRFMGKNHSSVVLAVQKMEGLLARQESLSWMTPTGAKHKAAGEVVSLLTQHFK